MGHAVRDPLYLSALLLAETDVPGVGDFCLRCHAPEAWLEGRCAQTDGSGLLDSDSGVTCSSCHRMDPNPWVRNAQYIIADESDVRGPYGDSAAPHRKKRSDWLSDSRLCGTCHDVLNPFVRRRTITGTTTSMLFPEQTTYSEWVASAFPAEGQTCQTCHMAESAGPIASTTGTRPDRSTHALAGGNTFLLDAIAFLEPGLGLSGQLALGRARVLAMLASAAELTLENPPAMIERGRAVELTLRVTNLSGHKLPTGYPEARSVTLSFTSPELGIVRPEAAVYQTVHGQEATGPGHHLALNDTVFSDTRIPPRGFVPTATTAPVGKIFDAIGGGVLAHWDDVSIVAVAPCDAATTRITAQATLLYRSVTSEYVDALVAAAPNHPYSIRLDTAFDVVDPQPIEMATLDIDIPIDPASTCDPPDAGFVDATPPDVGSPDAGFAPDAVVSADAATAEPKDDGGCGCHVSTRRTSYGPPFVGVMLSLAWFCRRRQRKGA